MLIKEIQLIPLSQPSTEGYCLRPGQRLTFGRGDEADIRLPFDGFLSSLHFAVECRPGGTVIRDLRSTNGTFLNKQRVYYGKLSSGDVIAAGSSIFQVRLLLQTQPTYGESSTVVDPL